MNKLVKLVKGIATGAAAFLTFGCGNHVRPVAVAAPPAPIARPELVPETEQSPRTLVSGALAAGYDHTCVVTRERRVQCWGNNAFAQLGDPRLTASKEPVTIPELTDVREIAAAGYRTCALRGSGDVWCWGSASAPKGKGDIEKVTSPRRVPGLSNVTRISVSPTFACALKSEGKVSCWGDGWLGVLGSGSTTRAKYPVRVRGIAHGIDLAVGEHHACALERPAKRGQQGVSLKCWGSRFWGKPGDSGPRSYSSVAEDLGGLRVQSLVHGRYFVFAGEPGFEWQSWGGDDHGERGTRQAHIPEVHLPMDAPAALGALGLAAGAGHTCGIFSSEGKVRCWGRNALGQLGNGTKRDSADPVEVENVSGAVALTAGPSHTCALLDNRSVRCWGRDAFFALDQKYAGTFDSPVPIAIAGL